MNGYRVIYGNRKGPATMSSERYSLRAVAPDAYAALGALDRTAHDAPLPRALLELVKMRASQLNSCAYCLDMHSKEPSRWASRPRSSSCSMPGVRRRSTPSRSVRL